MTTDLKIYKPSIFWKIGIGLVLVALYFSLLIFVLEAIMLMMFHTNERELAISLAATLLFGAVWRVLVELKRRYD